ncbi:MAG: polyphosphate polymerase domain-containing protein [Lachnospiraceae bacterium]
MAFQTVFKRCELKYLLTYEQKDKILEAMTSHMAPDRYGRTTIRNIYYDTETYRLIRRSIERPVYKEKLRLRSYSRVSPGSPVFVELKKKYKSVVYKRRLALPEEDAMRWLCEKQPSPVQTQISKEIDYFLAYYATLHPVIFLSYDREAYYSLCGDDFRVTFDNHILCRQENLSLEAEVGGIPLMDDGTILMEIKCSGGIPLWMIRVLSAEKIRKTSFSKYGTAYRNIIYPNRKEAFIYA